MAGVDLETLLMPWLDDPARGGIFTDFDGTLAPIVSEPSEAAALPGAIDVLRVLAGRYARVAVISGRTAGFLASEFGGVAAVPEGLTLVGLYGLERIEAGRVVPRPEAAGWLEVVDGVRAAAELAAPPGVLVERKGLAVGLHARRDPARLGWIEAFTAEQVAATGLVASSGKLSFEVRPPLDIDKGTVVDELAAGLGAVCFAGDDTGDLPAFAALARLRAAGTATLAIAARSAESPRGLSEAADLVVEGPPGVLDVWRRLAA